LSGKNSNANIEPGQFMSKSYLIEPAS
jgi:hypothetical protein